MLTRGDTQLVTGDWPAGVGIVLRADALGITFALLSVFVLLIATTAEAINGVRVRTVPGLAVLLSAGLSGLFLTYDVFNFYVFFELSMTVSYVLTAYGGRTRQLRAALVFTAVNLLGSFLFLLAVAGTYRVTGTLLMSDVAAHGPVSDHASLLIALFLRRLQRQGGTIPVPQLPTVTRYAARRRHLTARRQHRLYDCPFGGHVRRTTTAGRGCGIDLCPVRPRSSTALCWRCRRSGEIYSPRSQIVRLVAIGVGVVGPRPRCSTAWSTG